KEGTLLTTTIQKYFGTRSSLRLPLQFSIFRVSLKQSVFYIGGLMRSYKKLGLLLLAVIMTVVPKYWELRIDDIPPLIPPPPITNLIPKTEVVEDTIHKNRTLVATLVDYEVPVALANELADLIKPVFDVRKLRFGNPFRLEKESDGTLTKFEYKI